MMYAGVEDTVAKLEEYERKATGAERSGFTMMKHVVPAIKKALDEQAELMGGKIANDGGEMEAMLRAVGASVPAVLASVVMNLPAECNHQPPCAWVIEATQMMSLVAEGGAMYFHQCFTQITETVGRA